MKMQALYSRLSAYARLVRLDKPVGIYLLLWPTLNGLWVAAQGMPPTRLLLTFLLCTVLMRSAGCAINDYADRHFDAQVRRTQHRVLARGQIRPTEALGVGLVLMLIAGLLILQFSLAGQLWALTAGVIAATYPLTKRFFPVPQVYLGVAFSLGIGLAFLEIQQRIPAVAWWMMLANLLWTLAYDTAYALVDREDDLQIGIHSSAITFGRHAVAASMLAYSGFLLIYLGIGWWRASRWPFWLGWSLAALCVWEQYRLFQAQAFFKAFLRNSWLGAFLFLGLMLDSVGF